MLRLIGVNASAGGVAAGFESIASQTLSTTTASITFSSIPATYQHLQIRALVRGDFASNSNDPLLLRLNSDTGSNYVFHNLKGDGSSTSATGQTSQTYVNMQTTMPLNNTTASTFGVAIIDIHDYANTSKNTTVRCFSGSDTNSTVGAIQLTSGLWLNTNAVNSVTLLGASISFLSGSTFALYGIKGA